jgi:hypothetical protein
MMFQYHITEGNNWVYKLSLQKNRVLQSGVWNYPPKPLGWLIFPTKVVISPRTVLPADPHCAASTSGCLIKHSGVARSGSTWLSCIISSRLRVAILVPRLICCCSAGIAGSNASAANFRVKPCLKFRQATSGQCPCQTVRQLVPENRQHGISMYQLEVLERDPSSIFQWCLRTSKNFNFCDVPGY